MARARALVAASGTAGTQVEVRTLDVETRPLQVSKYFVALLRRLGYRTSLRVVGPAGIFADAADSSKRVQLASQGWQADALAASNFFLPLFTCESFVAKSSANANWSEFCDHRLDRKMRRAAALQASDPVQAGRLWSDVDRELVDRAVALPWGNLSNRVLVSERVGNYQSYPLWGTLLDQLWVR